MELEELKASWGVLNERLAQNEILNKRIIKEMITNRTQSAYERLFKFDLFGLVVSVVLCVLFPILDSTGQLSVKPLSLALLEGTLIVGLCVQTYLFSILARFNMEKKRLCELSNLALRYQLWMKRSYTYGTILAMTIIVAFFFIQGAYQLPDAVLRMSVALLLASFIMYYQIRFYKKNISAIEKGLRELAEFEKE